MKSSRCSPGYQDRQTDREGDRVGFHFNSEVPKVESFPACCPSLQVIGLAGIVCPAGCQYRVAVQATG